MDPIVSCPYDASHQIRKSKLPYHIARCKLSSISSVDDSKVCSPFNAFHIIDENCFESHVDGCPTVGNVKNALHTLEPQRQMGTVPLEAVKNLIVPTMKNWTEEAVETYDPWKNTLTKNIIRSISGGSKAQRRKFRLAERERLKSFVEEKKYKLHQTVFYKRNPSKEYTSMSQLVKNLSKMCLNKFSTSLECIMSNLHISTNNKFHQHKYTSQLAEEMLPKKLEKLLVHCMKKEVH